MNLKKIVMDAVEIFKLNEKTIKSVSASKDAFTAGALILVIAGIASAIGSFNLTGIIANPIMLFIGSFIWVGILYLFAWLFGGKGSYMEYWKPLSHSAIVSWISVIPFIGAVIAGILGLWNIVVAVKVTQIVHKLSLGKSIAVVLIPILILIAIAILLVLVVGAAIFAALAGGMMQ